MSVKYGDKKKLMFGKLLQLQKEVMRIVSFKTNDHPADALYLQQTTLSFLKTKIHYMINHI